MAVAWNWHSASVRSLARQIASGSFHQRRPFCQLRLRFCRAVVLMRSHDRLMSFELRDPWTTPIDGQIGWLQPRMNASPEPRRIACMPRRYAWMRVACGSWKRPPCMAPQKFASNLKYVQPHFSRIVRRSEEHTSELQSQSNLVCRLLLEKKKKKTIIRENIRRKNRVRTHS